MDDVDRGRITSYAMARLADPGFRAKLSAVTPAGERPIIAALRSDRLLDVIDRVHESGGAGNVLVPVVGNDGFVIMAIRVQKVAQTEVHGGEHLGTDCTVGVAIRRLIEDGAIDHPLVYYTGTDDSEEATTELVGVAE